MTEAFSFLNPISKIGGVKPFWIPRIAGIHVLGDREFALANLAPVHDSIIACEFPVAKARHHAEQIHGNQCALIRQAGAFENTNHSAVDGLITNVPGIVLGIYVADCAAIYLVDPVNRAIALLHSGRKGTEGNIFANAVNQMIAEYGSQPADLMGVVSPCIHPPHYEVDIAEMIQNQALDLKIGLFHTSCENTATHLTQNYSYRIEKGQTGRMLALMSIL